MDEIPKLLRGEKLGGKSDNIGSQNYTKSAVAVILGGGYDDAATAQMRKAAEGTKNVPWLRVDTTIPAPTPGSPEYAEAVMKRTKNKMLELQSTDKLGVGDVVFL